MRKLSWSFPFRFSFPVPVLGDGLDEFRCDLTVFLATHRNDPFIASYQFMFMSPSVFHLRGSELILRGMGG